MPPEVTDAPEESFVDEVITDSPETTKPTTELTEPAAPAKSPEWQDAIKELTQTVNRAVAPKEEAPAAPTEDEIAEYWGLYKPSKQDPEFFRKFLRLNTDMDPAEVERAVKEFAPVFESMTNGIARQSVTGARRILEKEIAKLREEFKPLQETVASTRAEKVRADFEGKYPALADKRYAKIISLVAKDLNDKEFDSHDSYFKALAEGAAKELSEISGSPFDLGVGLTKTKPAVTTPKLPRTSVGGQGGSGGGRAPAASVSDDDSATLDFMR